MLLGLFIVQQFLQQGMIIKMKDLK